MTVATVQVSSGINTFIEWWAPCCSVGRAAYRLGISNSESQFRMAALQDAWQAKTEMAGALQKQICFGKSLYTVTVASKPNAV